MTLMGLGYVSYQANRQASQAEAGQLNSQGVIYLDQDKPETAADLFRQEIRANPQYPTARHNLGMAYYAQGHLEQAIEQFQTAIALDAAYASPHYALGRVYDDQGQTEKAISQLQRAVELDPGMNEAYSELGYILNRQERFDEALPILQQGLSQGQKPTPPVLLKNLGRTYLGLGQPQQAVEHLEAAAAQLDRHDPLYLETRRLLAEAYEAAQDFDKALQEWEGSLRAEPDAAEYIQRLKNKD
jgi:tetratricopeptide (TPR) repeat protein